MTYEVACRCQVVPAREQSAGWGPPLDRWRLTVLVRPKHTRRDSRHQASRHHALRLRAQIIAYAGNHVAPASCKGFEASSSDLFGGFLVLTGELLLPGDGVEF
jgi:hypothetical protein